MFTLEAWVPKAVGKVPQSRWGGFPKPLGKVPKAVGESHIVPSCVKPLSIMDYEVKEDNL